VTTLAWTLLDLSLAALALGLGLAAVCSRDPRRGVSLFIAFGLLLALIWARLGAIDVALAEAAIGAGLAGALLLAALRDEPPEPAGGPDPGPAWLLAAALPLAGAFAWTLLPWLGAAAPPRLAPALLAQVPASGVSNPVTAVLLNFRAYDTLLELAVLLTASLGVLALGPAPRGYRPAGPVLAGLVQQLAPLLVLVAGYLLWAGAHAPGGAFQAGALLAAVGVLLHLGGQAGAGLPAETARRGLLAAGPALFLAVGLLPLALGQAFLTYPAGWAGALILAIEAAATLSIATALTLVYLGGRPPRLPRSDP
jgi:multisubunit Na+/H+ antiporter MnhB subunit